MMIFQMALEAGWCNRRSEQFGSLYQHLVNHALQRAVNHAARSARHYDWLTANIKRIPTPFRHDPRNDRAK